MRAATMGTQWRQGFAATLFWVRHGGIIGAFVTAVSPCRWVLRVIFADLPTLFPGVPGCALLQRPAGI